MVRIHVLGGTGYAGSNIVREAVKRGHEVTSFSRSMPPEPVEGARYVTGSVFDEAFLAQSVAGADVVFDALSPRGELEGKIQEIVDKLIRLATDAGVRFGVLGGASTMPISPGGPRLFDVVETRSEILAEVQAGIDLLDAMQGAPEELDWFYVAPATGFGSWAPGEATGIYRTSEDVLLVDENGDSNLSGPDLAKAVVDEIEEPRHRRARLHVAY
jgi:uncharacterized protein